MARLEQKATVLLEVSVRLTESEVAALNAIFGYDMDKFLETFYGTMGRAYLEPHEKALRGLAEFFFQGTSGILDRARVAREVFDGVRK